MTDRKITELNTIPNISPDSDILPIVDVDADETTSVTVRGLVDSVLNGGDVGIGTTSPTGLLTIGSSVPRLDFLESDGSAGFDNTALIRETDVFAIQTRNGGTFVSNDYRMTANASGALTHEWRIGNTERMRIDSSGIVDILGGTVELNGNELNGLSVTIADDAVASITFPTRRGGFLFLTCEGQNQYPQVANYSYAACVDFGTTPLSSPAMHIGTSVSVNNSDTPTGTTGTDGDLTVFLAGTAGTLYIENRTGTSRTWQVTLM